MEYTKMFKYLVIDKKANDDNLLGKLIRDIIGDIENLGNEVIVAKTMFEANIAIIHHTEIGCVLLDFDEESEDFSTAEIIEFIRKKGLDVPIFIVTERENISDITINYLNEIRGYIHPEEESSSYIAKYVHRAFNEYISALKTPFFGGLIDWAEAGNDMWLCPGHNGGNFLKKSPQGKILHDYLGEQFWRADFNFVPDLGDVMNHTGAYLESEKQAAKIFGADRAYFVLNGTSTSVKMVNGALLKRDDLVLFDRNNHKSHHHSLMLYGAIPIFIDDDRNDYGMVGPVNLASLNEEKIRQKIKNNPLVKDKEAWKKERPFRAIIIENNTYDGTIYNVQTIMDKLGHLADYIFFDEAWGAFMKFHPIYKGRFGMGLTTDENDPGIYVTHSTHKQLSGMSQASQILVKDKHIEGQKRHINHLRMNEVYMMHMSTSPFYPMYASLDVGAQMMKGRAGFALWDNALRMAIELRKKIREISKEYAKRTDPEKRWFFNPFVPDKVTITDSEYTKDLIDVAWEDVPTDVLVMEQQAWLMREGAKWHGYKSIKDDFVMIDPAKMMLLTPGINTENEIYEDMGVPAPMLGKYLRSRGIVHEKTDFNLILFLITPGIEKNKAGTLLTELIRFKEMFDENALMEDVYPELTAEFPDLYKGKGIKDIAQVIHTIYKKNNAKLLQKKLFQEKHFPEMAITPQEAQEKMLAGEVDFVPLTEAHGRIAATLALVYPPGIGVILPGERYDEKAKPMMDYFKLFEETNPSFPGFDNEIQGAYLREDQSGKERYFTYVVKE